MNEFEERITEMEECKQKFSILEDFYRTLQKKNVQYLGRISKGVERVDKKGIEIIKNFYNKALLRAEQRYLLAMVFVSGDLEDWRWVKEKINELKDKICYFYPLFDREKMPMGNAISANEASDDFIKEGYILATEDTYIKSSIIINDIAQTACDAFLNNNYDKDFFWELLNERVIGTMNIIDEMIRKKDPQILTFCRNILKNSKNESDYYKCNCYMILRDKHLKQDTELLIDFILRERNNLPKGWQEYLQETLVKLQKKLKNNKAKQK